MLDARRYSPQPEKPKIGFAPKTKVTWQSRHTDSIAAFLSVGFTTKSDALQILRCQVYLCDGLLTSL
jgi:hypothetical protein